MGERLWVRWGPRGHEPLLLNPGRGVLGNGGVLLLFQSSALTASSGVHRAPCRGGPFRLEQDPI